MENWRRFREQKLFLVLLEIGQFRVAAVLHVDPVQDSLKVQEIQTSLPLVWEARGDNFLLPLSKLW